MDENFSWKIIYIAAIFSLIVLGAVYFIISPAESPYFDEGKMEKIAEFRSTRVSGRKQGKKVWELFAQKGWTNPNRDITYLVEVTEGKIYKSGKLILDDLKAPSAKAYSYSEVVEAFGPLSAYLDLGKISDTKQDHKSDWTMLRADYLKYLPQEKRSIIRNNVALYKKDSSIFAREIIIDHDKKTALVSGKVKQKRKNGYVTATSLNYFGDEERIEAARNVYLCLTEGKIVTEIKGEEASFYLDINKDMLISGSLEAVQGKKMAVAQGGVYSQNKNELLMEGNVKAVFEKARAVLKEETVSRLKKPEAKEILKEKTVLTAAKLIFSTKSGDAQAQGSVYVTQIGKEAKADTAIYNDQNEILTLLGDVYLKKNSTLEAKTEWIKAEKIIISVRDETFEAIGTVAAEFKLKK